MNDIKTEAHIAVKYKSKVVLKVFKYSYIVNFVEATRGQNCGKGEFKFEKYMKKKTRRKIKL